MTTTPRIGIILASTRPGRVGDQVARWVLENARTRTDATFEIVDLAEQNLPLFDESLPPAMGQYRNEHTKRWAEVVSGFDGFVIVTPEYNHSIPAALKNALDYLHAEWNNKAVGFVSYGANGGVRCVEHLRVVVANLKLADVAPTVAINFATDFENMTTFTPHDYLVTGLRATLDAVIAWTNALAPLRQA
ncbi:NADPH-dependent FMN reductase [Acidipropionibacterium timonense]|uniref:NADPH-dependent FMN reductase n=1 Tax=Acidipropionibacterium timonense TaxID=2161818 RepID=UPI00103152F0|nr:NAD(P)H-dependent oxidoreductase [Acidipropionibacterium timonense]